jgi:hypothetical protein
MTAAAQGGGAASKEMQMIRALSHRPLLLARAGILVLLIAGAAPARATSTFSAALDVTVTLIAVGGETRIIGSTEVEDLSAGASGAIGTFASAQVDGEPDDPTILGVGDGITLESSIGGTAIDDPLVANEATASASLSGFLDLASFIAVERIVTIEVSYHLSSLAAAELLTAGGGLRERESLDHDAIRPVLLLRRARRGHADERARRRRFDVVPVRHRARAARMGHLVLLHGHRGPCA